MLFDTYLAHVPCPPRAQLPNAWWPPQRIECAQICEGRKSIHELLPPPRRNPLAKATPRRHRLRSKAPPSLPRRCSPLRLAMSDAGGGRNAWMVRFSPCGSRLAFSVDAGVRSRVERKPPLDAPRGMQASLDARRGSTQVLTIHNLEQEKGKPELQLKVAAAHRVLFQPQADATDTVSLHLFFCKQIDRR